MSYFKTIVCLANSRKTSGRCIAGKEWKNGNPGEWIRPVSERQTHEISEAERCYRDGQEPQLLDIINIPCINHQPLSHQRENHEIDASCYWSNQDRLAWQCIDAWLDEPDTLWGTRQGSYSGLNNRVSIGEEDGSSLYLIRVKSLRLLVGLKAPEYPDSKRAVRGEFTYRNVNYRIDITDPFIENHYLRQPDGQYDIANPVLCLSLGDPFQGYYYKLIAAVLYPERFL